MPPGSEEFRERSNQEYQYDHWHDWNVTEQRMRNAQNHLISFNSLAENEMPDESVGSMAHLALEHALKTGIAANGARYATTHAINMLRNQILEVDDQFQYAPPLDGNIYQQCRGAREYYDPTVPITSIPDCQSKVNEEIQALLARARELHQQDS